MGAMGLQELMIERIEEFGGIEQLNREIEKCKAVSKEKVYFDTMLLCFNNLYLNEMDVEDCAIEYRTSTIDAVNYLKDESSSRKNQVYSFLIELLEFKLSYVASIRKIS